MDYLLLLLSIALIGVAGFLFWQVREQRHTLQVLMEATDQNEPQSNPEMVLTLRVVDPISIAKRESRSARVVADRLPVMVTKMVYQEVMKELDEELRARDIDVEMSIEYR